MPVSISTATHPTVPGPALPTLVTGLRERRWAGDRPTGAHRDVPVRPGLRATHHDRSPQHRWRS